MLPIKKLIELGLLNWSVIALGLKNNWTNKKNIIDYAVNLLKNGDNNINIVSIAAGEYLDSHEFFSLVLTQAENKFFDYDIDKWRLAFLLCIDESNANEQKKIDKLQEVYSQFNYPKDMYFCSIYSTGNSDPLLIMKQVIKDLNLRYQSEIIRVRV
jgi:hypothetical protein